MEFPAQNCPSEINIIGEVPQESRYRATRDDIVIQKKRASSSLSLPYTIIKQASPLMILLFVTRAPHQYLPKVLLTQHSQLNNVHLGRRKVWLSL